MTATESQVIRYPNIRRAVVSARVDDQSEPTHYPEQRRYPCNVGYSPLKRGRCGKYIPWIRIGAPDDQNGRAKVRRAGIVVHDLADCGKDAAIYSLYGGR
jgi:hypothetical protein